ncbi:MAG TPA: DUF177 domain-containing protein [Myxococcales bacterium]
MNELILDIDALEEANRPFSADLPREFLDAVLRADPPTDFHAAGATHLSGRTTKMGRDVLVQAKFALPLSAPCKRCLKVVALIEPVELVRTFVPRASSKVEAHDPATGGARRRGALEETEPEVDGSFALEEADEDTYEGKELDLRPAVREQILLSLPSAPVCSEDCKGLCPRCGKDLNEGECGCDRTVMDPRWAALKGIQLESKKEK